jgi:hypothetical protein
MDRVAWDRAMAIYEAASAAERRYDVTVNRPMAGALERIAPRLDLWFQMPGESFRYIVRADRLGVFANHPLAGVREKAAAVEAACGPVYVHGGLRWGNRCGPRPPVDPDDKIALWLFRELMDDGFNAQRAGAIACAVGQAARENPDARAISYVQDYFPGRGYAYPADRVPEVAKWDEVVFPAGSDIRKVTTFRIGKLREMIAHYTEEQRAIIGDPDAE